MAKTDQELALEVIQGKYGNGQDRVNALGSRYGAVQSIVDSMMAGGNGGYSAPAAAPEPTSTAVTGKYGTYEYGKMPTYESRYRSEIDKAQNQLKNYTPYASNYQGQIDAIQNQLKDYTPYTSKYQPQIDAVQQAISNYGDYQSKYQPQIDEYLNKLLGDYDVTQDASYQALKDAYTRGGKRAMLDTMSQASALTGGYGNSYAQSVGQQQYQEYMAALADRIPELTQLANEMFSSRLNMLGNLDAIDYGRWADKRSDLYNQLNSNIALDENDYKKWADERDDVYNQLNAYLTLDKDQYSKWAAERENIYNQLDAYMALDKDQYGKWQDEYNAYLKALEQQKAKAEAAASASRGGDSSSESEEPSSDVPYVTALLNTATKNGNSYTATVTDAKKAWQDNIISDDEYKQARELALYAKRHGDLR